MARERHGQADTLKATAAEHREQLEILSRTLEREGHVLFQEPEALPSHLHNMLYLDEGEEGAAGPVLARAREALAGRPWLRLTNRPPVERSAVIRVMEHGSPVEAVTWSPDCTIVASGGWDSAIRLWEATTGRCRTVLKGHTNSIEALAWSPDGRILASTSLDFTLRLRNPDIGECRQVVEGNTVDTTALAWSPDAATLASAGSKNVVRLRDPATGQPRAVLQGHTDWIDALAWSPDNRTLASAGRDGTIRLWDTATGQCRQTLEVAGVDALAWSPDGRTQASAGGGTAICIWDAGTGAPRAVLEGHTGPVLALAWSPQGDTLASGSIDRAIRLWDVASERCRARFVGHTAWVQALAWSPDGRALASGSRGSQAGADNSVRLWDPRTDVSRVSLEAHADEVHSLAWSPDGAFLASGGEDDTVRLWESATGKPIAVLEGHTALVKSLAWSPDGQELGSGAFDGSIRVWDSDTRHCRATLQAGEAAAPWALAWSPDTALLASGSNDGTVRLWDPVTQKNVAILEGHTSGVTCLAWSPDGRFLASGDGAFRVAEGTIHFGDSAAATVRLWDPVTAKCRAVLKGHPDLVLALAWSRDGRALACGTGTGLLRGSDDWNRPLQSVPTAFLLDVAASRYRPLEGYTGRVNALAWSPDGQFLASAREDATICLCNSESGSLLATVHCLSPVGALQFSDDGRILRAADNGAATGNRPIPYVFELCNIEVGPPVAPPAPSPPRVAEPAAPRVEEEAAERPPRAKAAPHERAPRPPTREKAKAPAPSRASLEELLEGSSLTSVDLGGGTLAVPFRAERADQLVVHARKLGDDLAYFVVNLPKPGWLSQEGTLRNLLRVSFQANYVKALAFDSGELALAVELPTALLSPNMVEGLIRGLSHLADVKAGDLAKWDAWEERLAECTRAQATRLQVDVQQAEETVPRLAQAAGLPCTRRESGTFVIDWELAGMPLKLAIGPSQPVISSIVYLAGVRPKGDKKKYMRRLLELNRKANVAKVGLDSDGDVALLYEVPQVFADLLDKAKAQMQPLLVGVVDLEATKS